MSESVAIAVRRRRSRVEAERLVVEFDQSGLTRQAFCAQHGLSVGTLARYREHRRSVAPVAASRMLPVDGDLWAWCLEQKQGVLLELLAFCAATTINAVQVKSDRPECGRLSHADRLTAALGRDMKAWFTADAANYFSRVSKPQILDAIKEAKQQPPAPAWEKLKKADLAQEAERQLSGSGWLPMLLRSPI